MQSWTVAQLGFVAHCVKHRKACCMGLGFSACHRDQRKVIKMQQKAANHYCLQWLGHLVPSRLASSIPSPTSFSVLDKALVLSLLSSLKTNLTSSSLWTQGQRKDNSKKSILGHFPQSTAEPDCFYPASREQGRTTMSPL